RSTTAWTPQAGPLVRSRRYRSQRRGDAEGCTTVRGKNDGHNDWREGSRTPCAVNWAKLKYIVVPAEAGIQAKAARHARGGLDSGLRRSDKGGYQRPPACAGTGSETAAPRAENLRSAAPAAKRMTIDKIAIRELPVTSAVVPMSNGPSTAANLPIML